MRLLLFFSPLFFLGLLPAGSRAQTKEIVRKGMVLDSLEKTPVEGCTVSVMVNGAVASKTATNEKGQFSLKTKTDSALLLLQHVGYTEKRWLLTKPSTTDTIFLSPADKVMDDVVIKAAVPPVVVRGDTTEYNIDSSMFEPFDVVEDLVRRLPGLEIDDEGRMRFHGKSITRILVDGEELFTGDPNFSMKKLPAGLVSKIQVMDTKTLEQVFSGLPPDGDDKTLNIKLKSGAKTFGTADGMLGSKNQLDANVNLSQFDEDRKYSLMGSYNSSNRAGIFKNVPGPTGSFTNLSANFGDKWGDLRIGGSYGYSRNASTSDTYRERTQLVTADTSIFTRSANRYSGAGDGHHVNIAANWWIDSSTIFDANLSYANGTNKSTSLAWQTTVENGALRNESVNQSSTEGLSQNLSANLSLRKWLNRKGRYIFANFRTNVVDQRSELLSQSTNTYFKGGLPVNGDTLDRRTIDESNNRSYSVGITYAEPISKSLRFTVNGNFDLTRSTSERSVFNLDSVTHTAVPDSTYSAAIFSSVQTQNLSVSLGYTSKKVNVSTGLSTIWQQTVRTAQKQDLRQNLLRFAPTLNATVNLTQQKMLRANFSATTIQPTPEQLQPVPDNSNPLYIRMGNPNLRTAFSQNYGLSYGYSDTIVNFMASAAYAPVSNQIVAARTYDAYRRILSQSINVSGVYTARGNASYSHTVRRGKVFSTWNISSGLVTGRQAYFQSAAQYDLLNYGLNAVLSFSRRRQAVRSPSFSLSFAPSYNRQWTPTDLKVQNTTRLNLAPAIDLSCVLFTNLYLTAGYKLWYNKLNYHSAQRRNDEYSLHQASNVLRLRLLKKWSVQTAFTYRFNTQAPEGVNRAQFNSNFSVNGALWKGRGQLSLTAVDLFATPANLQRSVGENYIEDVQTNNLRNYFTAQLQWNFSKLERRSKAQQK